MSSHSFIKSFTILGLGQVVPKFISLALVPLLTRYLSTDEFGFYDLVMTSATLAVALLTCQVHQGLFRFLLTEKNQEKYYISSIIILALAWMPVSLLAITVVYGLSITELSEYFWSIFFFIGSNAMFDIIGQISRGLKNNTAYSISIGIYSVINITLIILFILLNRLDLHSALVSSALGYTCSSIFLCATLHLYDFIKFKYVKVSYTKEVLLFSLPILPSSISIWIVNFVDRVIITIMLGPAVNALYAAANKIPSLINIVYSVFNLAWSETATLAVQDEDKDSYYSKSFSMLIRVTTGCVLVLMSITPIIFYILIDDKYLPALSQIPILYLVSYLNGFVLFYSGIYLAMKRTKEVGISSVLGAILNIILCISMIPNLGIFGAAIATLISYAVIVLYRAYDLNKVITINYNSREIFFSFISIFVGMLLVTIGSLLTYSICLILSIVFNIIFNKNILKISKVKVRK